MEQVVIVMVPFTAQGHLNPLLHFAISLSSTYNVDNLSVHYACSASYVRQARSRIQGWDPASLEKVHFHELPLAPFPCIPLPDPSSDFPTNLLLSLDAALRLRSPLAALFLSLSAECRRLVVVYDPGMSFVGPDVASLPNAESYRFHCVPSHFALHSLCQQPDFDASKLRPEVPDVILDPFEGCLAPQVLELLTRIHRDHVDAEEAGTLFNGCRPIEGEFLDLLSGMPRYRGKKVFAVGPVNPLAIERRNSTDHCLEWLDEQPPASVLYVSFGSISTMSDEQTERLATALEHSGQRFIWVLRDADLGDIFADGEGSGIGRRELPAGFEERMEGRGMVVRGWAPQLPILAHPSTGGFMSHCGWNSCMDSLSMGVPIVAWPMHSDQPRNAVLVTEYLKTGVALREWARHRDPVSSEAIEKAIRKVMVQCCEEGKEMRKRARVLGEAIRLSVAEGGSSRADFDSFVHHITRDVRD